MQLTKVFIIMIYEYSYVNSFSDVFFLGQYFSEYVLSTGLAKSPIGPTGTHEYVQGRRSVGSLVTHDVSWEWGWKQCHTSRSGLFVTHCSFLISKFLFLIISYTY